MPAKNAVKDYETKAYYHIYNRGVEKRTIFQDKKDYKVFLNYLKVYLSKPPTLQGVTLKIAGISRPPSRQLKNYADEIDLLCYCLMPNHFHLLVQQHTQTAIQKFMQSLCTKYSTYFNAKYSRVGKLFQGVYKAVKVTHEEQLLWLTHYIHRNCDVLGHKPEDYPYSSLKNYLGFINQQWLKPANILQYFSQTNPKLRYANFISDKTESEEISPFILD